MANAKRKLKEIGRKAEDVKEAAEDKLRDLKPGGSKQKKKR